MMKVLYKPVGMLVSVLGGVLAGAIFKRVWKLAAGEDEAPKATDARRGWREVLLAAALQGAIFALVKAVVDRAAAEGARKLTGVWPGDGGQQSDLSLTRLLAVLAGYFRVGSVLPHRLDAVQRRLPTLIVFTGRDHLPVRRHQGEVILTASAFFHQELARVAP